MSRSLSDHLINLRAAILEIKATGPSGFEGLMADVLTDIGGIPFRLANSGSQFGVDGKAAFSSVGVSFECKRYESNVPRSEVLSKVAELALQKGKGTDLWVLCATVAVSTQIVDSVSRLAEQHGVAVIVLDWTSSGIPPLATALASARTTSEKYLNKHVANRSIGDLGVQALKAISEATDFEASAKHISQEIKTASLGEGLALRLNAKWLQTVFADKRSAKNALGQSLCPGQTPKGELADRRDLVDTIHPYLSEKPDGQVVAILGEEGVGKSWSVAMSWLTLTQPPLMVFFSADEFTALTSADEDKCLIETLIAQSGDRLSEVAIERWRRRFRLWCEDGAPNSPRIVVVIDGVNQRPDTDWGRLIDRFASKLDRMGGRLVITSRTTFFISQIKPRLISELAEVHVSQFTNLERNRILQACGVHLNDNKRTIAEALNNPRLLGVAIALLKSSQIESLDEVNVSRLLFEYIRASDSDNSLPQSAHEFASELQQRARDVLRRLQDKQSDDLAVFDRALVAASEGRFFQPIPGEPLLYRLHDDGLTLALALAVINELKKAERNRRETSEVLSSFVEPIEQLDLTADVLLAAIIVASLSDDCSPAITAALVSAFSHAQNPNASEFSAFASAAKLRTEAFMLAAKELCLSGDRQPNFDWIHAALTQATVDSTALKIVSKHLMHWLALYSLSPERRMFTHRSSDSVKSIDAERRKVIEEVDSKLAALSTTEKAFLDTLSQCDQPGLSNLHRLTFTLLAGTPLCSFGKAFVQWSFSNALHSDHGAPANEFYHLLRFNRIDWKATRETLLREAAQFEGTSVSQVGRWALVRILGATAHPDDALKSGQIVAELTINWPKFESWRLVEDYCAADPCDPASVAPGNINVTSERYAAVDVSSLRVGRDVSSDDHYFSMARPSVARFDPDVGLQKHRELIAQVIEREDHTLRYGMFGISGHGALVKREFALRLLANLATRNLTGPLKGDLDRNQWIVSQYHLLLAFPLLSAKEQVDSLLAQSPKDGFLLILMNLAKLPEEGVIDQLLDFACGNHDEEAQVAILAFARASASTIGIRACALLVDLVRSPSTSVRAQAFAWIAGTNNLLLVRAVAASDWRAKEVSGALDREAWYGSFVLILAAKSGFIDLDLALERISPRLYGRAAVALGPNAAHSIAGRVDASIRRIAGLDLSHSGLELSSLTLPNDVVGPEQIYASEQRDDLSEPGTVFHAATETDDAFERRQQRIKDSFEKFRSGLSKERAEIILDNLSTAEFDTIALSNISLASTWHDLLLDVPEMRRPWICNIGILVAHAFSHWDSAKAAALFSIFGKVRPSMRFTFGYAALPLGSLALWSARDSAKLDDLRFSALDAAATDSQISEQVFACLKNGRRALLRRYIDSRLSTGHPAEIARALMVAGFSEDISGNRELLLNYKDRPGFIGQSCAAAIYAFERNTWARHWFQQMRDASEPEEFWRYSILLSKIVDGRIDIWGIGHPQGSEVFRLYWPTVQDEIKRRCEKWRTLRDRKLFGDTAPAKVFVTTT